RQATRAHPPDATRSGAPARSPGPAPRSSRTMTPVLKRATSPTCTVSLVAFVLAAVAHAEQPPTAGRVTVSITTLEGTVHMPGVQVELRAASDPTVIARTITDGAGLVAFPDVPVGRYVITASREGFLPKDSPEFEVRAGHDANVQLDIQLTFQLPAIDVRAATASPSPSPTNSVRPVSMSDMLSGS